MERLEAIAKAIWESVRHLTGDPDVEWEDLKNWPQGITPMDLMLEAAQRVIEVDANFNRPF